MTEIEDDAVDFVNEKLRITTWEVDEAYRTLPLADIARMAVWLRERAHLVVGFLGLDNATESQLDDRALLVSMIVHTYRAVRPFRARHRSFEDRRR